MEFRESVSGHVPSRSVIIVLRAVQRIGGQALIWLDNDKEKAIKVNNIIKSSNHLFQPAFLQLHVAFVPEGTPLAMNSR